MFDSQDSDDFWSHDNCGCGYCDGHQDMYNDDEDIYDDPYEVVMYDITVVDDDLYALIDMLEDSARSWYANRRLNSLAASGPLSALVADIIIDSLGRRWDPLLHPRDRFGRFINTGGFFRWLMGGVWHRGQVSRIDSDGVIHARSVGNDRIPDGAPLRFKHEQAVKLVSTESPVADLTPPDFDADIPDFPEASDIQKRIYNHLGEGNVPVVDLDRSLGDVDLSAEDFAGELQGLVERGLIEVDRSGDAPRARRSDDDDLGVIDVGDDQIADVPEDETPDLEDSPSLTREQRSLLDFIADADRGEGDGVAFDELDTAAESDIEALVEAGALIRDDNDRLHLENPEEDVAPAAEAEVSDTGQEIFEAANGVSDDPDVQEAFQHFAEELARPGDENNIPLPEGLPAAKRRNAESAAQRWWDERGGATPSEDVDEAPETEVPEAEQANPRDVLNPRNQAMADASVAGFFPDDEFLDSPVGEEYRGAVKRLFDAEDLEENGFDAQAAAERDKADRAMRRIGVPENEIPEWHDEVRAVRSGEREDVEPDVTPDVTPELSEEPDIDDGEPPLILPGDEFDLTEAPEAAEDILPEEEALPEPAVEEPGSWRDFNDRLNEEGLAGEFYERLDQESRIAEELGLDIHEDPDAPWSWTSLAEGIGYRPAELMFEDSNGSIGEALAKDPASFVRQYENELLEKFQNREASGFGPEVMRLRQAGLIESTDGGNDWRLTEAGRQRLGLVDELPADEGLAVEEVELPSESELAEDREVEAPAVDVERILDEEEAIFQAQEADLVPAADNPAYAAVINQPDFLENKPDVSREGAVLDRNGQPVVLGAWYKANRGGEGDPDQVIGYLNQEKYPGFVLVQAPDGKLKIVDAQGEGPLAGLNRMPDPGTEARARIRVQRAVGGDELLDLDQNNPKNVLWAPRGEQGQMAEIGMRVGGRGDKGLFREGDQGVIVRIGWNAGQNRPNIFVVKEGQKRELQLAPRSLVPILEGTPTTPPTPTPAPGVPDLDPDNLPDREWGVPSDVELVDRLNGLGGEVDYIKFVNAFVNPGVVDDQIRFLIDDNQLEFAPEAGNGRPQLRIPGRGGNAPEAALPDGAEDEFEAAVLNAIDGAGEGGLRKGEIVPNLDDDDAGDRLIALRALVERGVLREFVGDDGRPHFERVVVTPEPELPNGAQNEIEADLLNVIDAAGDTGAVGADLVDIDADDAADRMSALRSLVERRVLRRVVDPDTGRPVYRRPQSGGSTPVSMSNEEASRALSSGADPVLVVTDNLERVMRDSGYSFSLNGQAGISQDNFWAVAPQDGPFPVSIRSSGGTRQVSGRVYMVKRSSGSSLLPNDVLNEVMAGAISEDVKDRAGADAPGLLYHPRVALASAPQGLGSRAGGAIVMDHASYGFPEGHILHGGLGVVSEQLFDGGASEGIIGLALYDYLINNTQDRHRQNQMYVEDPNTGKMSVVIIDNGFGFGADGSPDNLSFQEYASKGRPSALLGRARARQMGRERVEKAVQQFVDTYQQMDVDAIMDRIRALFPSMSSEQEAYVRQHLTISKNRVDFMDLNIGEIIDTIMNT